MPNSRKIRIVFADDDRGLCKLASILLDFETDLQLVATETTGKGAIAAVAAYEPDLLITDFRLPDMTGLDVCNAISRLHPDTLLLVVSGYSKEDLAGSLNMTKFMYMDKRAAFLDFAGTIRDVVR